MEIPARYFFWIWAVIGFSFLKFGLDAVDKTELSNTVSPLVMSSLKFSLAISTGCSFIYAVAHHPQLNIAVDLYFIVFVAINSVVLKTYISFLCLNFLLTVINCLFSLFSYVSKANLSLKAIIINRLINWAVISTVLLLTDKILFSAGVLLSILNLIPTAWLANLRNMCNRLKYLLPIITDPTQENLLIFNKRKGGKWIEFAVGMVGTILFQNFFRLNSFKEVLVFIYFAVSWLANLVLVSASNDFGVFNFLLGNVIVGSTVNESGLRRSTWIAYGTCLLLFGLRLKLESLSLVNREGEETQVVVW